MRIALDLIGDVGATELYVGREYLPTAQQYDFRQSQWNSADTSALLSATTDHTYYLVAVANTLTSLPANCRISAEIVPFQVLQVSPTTVGNSGPVTLELFGAGFTLDTTFQVGDGAGHQFTAQQTYVPESGHAFATFNLGGFSGTAMVQARQPGGATALAQDPVNVIAGGGGELYAQVTGPDQLRTGRWGTWYVTYGNRGNSDIPLPVVQFSVPGAQETHLFDSTVNWGEKVTLWGLNDRWLLPTLGPGQHVTVPIQVKPGPGQTVTAQVSVIPGETTLTDATPFNWLNHLPSPAGVDPQRWIQEVQTLDTRLGVTVGDYFALLHRDLATLRDDNLRNQYIANVDGQWLLGPEPLGVPVLVPIRDVVPQPPTPIGPPNLPPGPDGIPRTWFVVIVAEDYGGNGDRVGGGAEADDLRQYVEQDLRTPQGQVEYVVDRIGNAADDMTEQRILDAITALRGKVDADDKLVIVYNGHGGRDAAGAGYMALRNNQQINAAEVQAAIDAVAPGITYFLNASCHSAALTDAINPTTGQYVGISATKSDTVSWRDTATGNHFTTFLKANLRACYGLQEAYARTVFQIIAQTESWRDANASWFDLNSPENWQVPKIQNLDGVDLTAKPWNDPTGFEKWLGQVLNSLPSTKTATAVTKQRGSVDPNDKIAPAGTGPENFIQADDILPYVIRFENLSSATAPAQDVLVSDSLDADLDWSTFQITEVGFNDVLIDDIPAGLQQYTTQMTVGSDPNPVDVTVAFDAQNGTITWRLRSRDPVTQNLPEDPWAGFLPPNDETGRGEGYVSYNVRPRAGLSTGTQIGNRATITFDPEYQANPPIETPEVFNTLDAGDPDSQVALLAAQSPHQLWVTWGGEDEGGAGAGIAAYDVFVSDDGGPYALWLADTTDAAAVFTGQVGHTYRFYSVAVDNVGHRQAAPVAADTQTQVVSVNWQNPWNRFDVSGDGKVDALDALLPINYINAHPGSSSLPPLPALPPHYYDVDGDQGCWPQDVLAVINQINSQLGLGGEAEVALDVGESVSDLSGTDAIGQFPPGDLLQVQESAAWPVFGEQTPDSTGWRDRWWERDGIPNAAATTAPDAVHREATAATRRQGRGGGNGCCWAVAVDQLLADNDAASDDLELAGLVPKILAGALDKRS